MHRKYKQEQTTAPWGCLFAAAAIYAVCLSACGSSTDSSAGSGNATAGGNVYTLTITNQDAWCNVTATVDGNQLASFSGEGATLQAAASATVNLNATAQPGFQDPQWTGTTSTTSPTTYVMTANPNQTVNVYCE